ncbi:hypothetical protein ST201phi2-1p120 [Pseudomonas phage 201phi2-1]|uniref:Uncharacterized protein n=1 Tax=Pseudomonas phage 201phi2-1 TaxID=198110 RepID=B3FIY3_BP201|nr:hypothetical protein ST201phi2-1p120 [Pseudomonas phage 201phi2-1]ABY62952.1 hypothetical protein 201phi2-1p120 [Pseudomonas phage 201phi2-1]
MSKPNYLNGMLVGYQELDRAINDILANDERQTPVVGEDVFINHIIPILQQPWKEENLRKYGRYVVEPTQALRVAGVRDGKTVVLFTIPPLMGRVDTTSPVVSGITVNQLVEYASIMRARHTGENVDGNVTEYLHQITNQIPPEQKVLVPIGAILGVYGKTFLDDMGHPLYSLEGVPNQVTGELPRATDETQFVSAGYIDED